MFLTQFFIISHLFPEGRDFNLFLLLFFHECNRPYRRKARANRSLEIILSLLAAILATVRGGFGLILARNSDRGRMARAVARLELRLAGSVRSSRGISIMVGLTKIR